MRVFVDTSALLAVLDADEERHKAAARRWRDLLERDTPLITTNYVLVETFALAQSRLGIEAVRALDSVVIPLLDIHWVEEELHRVSVTALLVTGRRALSLVDACSFETMRRLGVRAAFTLDRQFKEQGFETLP